MKYKYKFADGVEEIDLDESWYKVLLELDHEEELNDLAQKRRHYKIEAMEYESLSLSDRCCSTDLHYGEDAVELSRRSVLSVLSLLPARDRRIIQLKYYEGFSQTEIAAIEGVNKATVTKLLNRIYKNMKGILKNFENDGNF